MANLDKINATTLLSIAQMQTPPYRGNSSNLKSIKNHILKYRVSRKAVSEESKAQQFVSPAQPARKPIGISCPRCTFINPEGSVKCSVCDTILPSAKKAEGISCPQCTFINPPGTVKCSICNTNLLAAKKPEGISCPQCTFINPEATTNCNVCGTKLQPGPQVKQAESTPIDDLVREIYGDYISADFHGKVDSVIRKISSGISISTLFEHGKGRLQGGLFQGNINAAKDRTTIERNGIGLIIQVSSEELGKVNVGLKNMPKKPIIRNIGLQDTVTQPLSVFLDGILPEIVDARERGINVLVNCSMGMSRSTAIILAHLMDPSGENMSLLEALRYNKQRRPEIIPNIGFLTQLMIYEKKLRKSSSVPLEIVAKHPEAVFAYDNVDLEIANLRHSLQGGTRHNKYRMRKTRRKH